MFSDKLMSGEKSALWRALDQMAIRIDQDCLLSGAAIARSKLY